MLGLRKKVTVSKLRRRRRIQKRVVGSTERPRLVVFRSLKHMYAQIIDDSKGITLVAASSQDSTTVPAKPEIGGKIAVAKLIGAEIAKRAKEKGIDKVVFDRNVYLYHGRVKALADAARENGLSF